MVAALTQSSHRRRAFTGAVAVLLLALAGCGSGGSSSSSGGSSSGSTTHSGAAAKPRTAATVVAPSVLSYRPLYSLPAALQDPGSAALSGGRFVLMGGLDAADTSTSAVIVGDGSTAHRSATLPNAQHDAQAATLGGRVYLFGGGQFNTYDHILAFDPASGAVASVGTLPRPASDVAVAGDGSTAYVVGGYDGTNSLDTILSYRPGASPRVAGHLPVALRYAAVAVAAGGLIIAGGSTPSGTASDAVYRFDPASGQVRRIGRLAQPLTHAGAAVLHGFVYLIGGRGASTSSQTTAIWAINPTTGRIRAAGHLPQPLSDPGVVGLTTGIVIAGGRTSAGTQSGVGELRSPR
jgi:hypothetical protein